MADLREGLDPLWGLLLTSWNRSMEAARRAPKTRKLYLDAATALINYLADSEDPPSGVEEITKAQIEEFLIWFGTVPTPRRPEGRGDAYVNQTFRAIQQWFKWLLDEEEITHSPLERMSPPKVDEKPVPVLHEDEIKAVLAACAGKTFTDRRDNAIIRCLLDSGGRRTEIARLRVDDVDLTRKVLNVLGKGHRPRPAPIGNNTALALGRYMRLRTRDKHASRPELWLADRSRGPLTSDGLARMVGRRGEQAGIKGLHPHQFRHTLANDWQFAGGSEGDLMRIMGWSSRQMVDRYAKIAQEKRAQQAHERLALGDRF